MSAHDHTNTGNAQNAQNAQQDDAVDAAQFARRHAGDEDPTLTPAQRDLLGRVIAKRIEQGIAMRLIQRAVAHALPELGVERAHRLARAETMRAFAQEQLAVLRRRGAQQVTVSVAADACPVCQAGAGQYAIDAAPHLPVVACEHASGCRCLYATVDTH